MTRLQELYERGGQSPWIDNLKRSWLTGGHLAELIGAGVRGLTSNPTIMAKAIEEGDGYDDQFEESYGRNKSVLDAYWDLVVTDVEGALDHFRPLYDASHGTDGFVSIEVAPSLARDTPGTIEAARGLHERIARPNVLVKIPATEEGVPAIRRMISEGHSINVTLIFSLERYEEVMEAYLAGLEALVARGGDPSRVASVASFFVSRVDTETDRRLEAITAEHPDTARAVAAHALLGKTAVAQARLAYEHFLDRFSGERWERLLSAGARPQRPLWASTSTKNPLYPDLLYVETLIGPDTVNTMPEQTLDAFLDHGHTARTVSDFDRGHEVLDALAEVGVDLADVACTLEDQGVTAFEKSFDEVGQRLENRAAQLGQA
ncbi:MAG: transaldolase [Acidimicrobiales bacterium]|jgi:transaldolase